MKGSDSLNRPPALHVEFAGRVLEVPPDGTVTVGRGPSSDLSTDNGYVSRSHARLHAQDGAWVLEDNGSSRGTFLDGSRVTRVVIDRPMTLTLGPLGSGEPLVLRLDAPEVATDPVPIDAPLMLEPTRRRDAQLWITIQTGRQAGETFVVDRTSTIGRDPECEIVIDHDSISRRHATLSVAPMGGVLLTDLGSTNGTWLNGKRVAGEMAVSAGDELRFGSVRVLAAASTGSNAPSTRDPRLEHGRSTIDRVRDEVAQLRRRPLRALGLSLATAVAAGIAARVILAFVFPAPTVAEVVANVESSTVLVVSSVNGQRQASGSGWIVDASQGLVITNHHVVEAGTSWSVTPVGGEPYEASLVATAACDDVSLLRAEGLSGESLALGDQGELRRGDAVVAIGFPTSAAHADNVAATAGVVSVARTAIPTGGGVDYANTIQTDAAINLGNSGGPLVTMDAELVGMNTLVGLEVENQAFAIGVDRIRELLPLLSSGQSTNWTGLALSYADAEALSDAGLPHGPFILGAVPGTPAAAEFPPGTYQLLQLDGQELDPALDMADAVCRAVRTASGTTLTLRIAELRGLNGEGPLELGDEREVEITLP